MQTSDIYLSEDLLNGLFDQPGWKIATNHPYWITFQVPTYKDAVYIAKYLAAPIVANGDNGLNVFVQYIHNHKRIICQINQDGEFMSQAQLNIAGVTIGGPINVNRELLDVFGEMLSNPERSIGLVRLSDERQISVSGGADGKYLVGASVDQATSWKRADYWHPEDLHEFNRTWQQSMEPNSNKWFEYRYRSFDPLAPAYAHGPNFCDFEFITKYKLVTGPTGELFHVAENVDMVAL